MTREHTPGPWLFREHATEYPDLKEYTLHAPRGYQEPDTGEFKSCGIICGVIDNLPDARLIAAAPDMLDALRDAECELFYASNGSISPEAVRDALAKVRAAMVKATA